jgi:hypothetical protein
MYELFVCVLYIYIYIYIWKQYEFEITKRFAALENLSDGEDINRAWENIEQHIKTSAKESLGLH